VSEGNQNDEQEGAVVDRYCCEVDGRGVSSASYPDNRRQNVANRPNAECSDADFKEDHSASTSIHYMDFPDCLLLFLSISVFYF